MLTKKNLYKAIFIAFISLLFSACKKSSTNTNLTPSQTLLLGKWSEYQDATDDNNNGIADPIEILPLQSGEYSWTFNSDGSGISYAAGTSHSFTWLLKNNNTILEVTLLSTTIDFNVIQFTTTNLTLESNYSGFDTWDYYSK